MTTSHNNHDLAAKKIVSSIGKKIVLGIPLGIGKPLGFVNALYRLAEQDSTLDLTILTALTLSRPTLKSTLEKEFIEPILNRLYNNYEDPLYEIARKKQKLPSNIHVIEFFLTPGEYLTNHYVQQHYISSNYSTVIQDVTFYSVNVLAQQVSQSSEFNDRYSLSCNTDLFHSMAEYLKKSSQKPYAIVAEINDHLPYMPGEDAELTAMVFTDIIDTQVYPQLFSIPLEALSIQDHMIGLTVSTLIKDNSCIQIGIGSLNNAIAYALASRNNHNHDYKQLISKMNGINTLAKTSSDAGETDIFSKGLYASTEMFSDEYTYLYDQHILKKRVYDHLGLQDLLNKGLINDSIHYETLIQLMKAKLINSTLTESDVNFLKYFGVLSDAIQYEDHYLIIQDKKFVPDLLSSSFKMALEPIMQGQHLKNGKVLHAAFFLGSSAFYEKLRQYSKQQLSEFAMTSVLRTNTALWNYELAKSQRQNTRFINFGMMVTLGGAVVSDGLNNLQEVSGIGGQFDFIHMASILPGARSIIACRSVRETKRGIQSNIIWEHPNLAIPRSFRDIIVTEYGIADCRSKTDAEVIKAILNITDSRFQSGLLTQAKKSGKVELHYQIPEQFSHNYPQQFDPLIKAFANTGFFKEYPFGSDLTVEEQYIAKTLLKLKKSNLLTLIQFFFAAFSPSALTELNQRCLKRLNLQNSQSLQSYFYKKLFLGASINRFVSKIS
jgi:acyl-CoA hydrolase